MNKRKAAIKRIEEWLKLAAKFEALNDMPKHMSKRKRRTRERDLQKFLKRHPKAALFTTALMQDFLTVAKGDK